MAKKRASYIYIYMNELLLYHSHTQSCKLWSYCFEIQGNICFDLSGPWHKMWQKIKSSYAIHDPQHKFLKTNSSAQWKIYYQIMKQRITIQNQKTQFEIHREKEKETDRKTDRRTETERDFNHQIYWMCLITLCLLYLNKPKTIKNMCLRNL